MEKLKYALAVVGGVVCSYLGRYATLYMLVGSAVLFDLLSGTACAVMCGEGLSSKVARKGVMKKLMMLFSVAFGTFLDVLLPWCVAFAGVETERKLLFSAVMSAYICISESISVLENIARATGAGMPRWITKLLKETKDTLE